jgi:hypothetical protein
MNTVWPITPPYGGYTSARRNSDFVSNYEAGSLRFAPLSIGL